MEFKKVCEAASESPKIWCPRFTIVVSCAEVIEAGPGVAFFAGEVHGTDVCGAGAIQAVAEGEAGAGFVDIAVEVGAHALGAEPVAVLEIPGIGVVCGVDVFSQFRRGALRVHRPPARH